MSEKGCSVKKKPSGFQNRKRKAENEKKLNLLKKSMNINKYLEKQETIEKESGTITTSNDVQFVPVPLQSPLNEDSVTENEHLNSKNVNEELELKDLKDVALWPTFLNNVFIDHVITVGPVHIKMDKFPQDTNGRHFNNSYYIKKLPNGETISRRWLVYSVSKNCVYCFCCRLFSTHTIHTQGSCISKLISEGYNDWKHVSEIIKLHEMSVSHKQSYQKWVETELRLRTGETIDKQQQQLIGKESLRWNNVLCRLMNITLYLAENNMAFRGSSDKLFTANNGKFLGLVQLLAKFDPIMQEHIQLAMKNELSDHYCGKNIQNELIDVMASKVKEEIVLSAKKSKYFSIIADCTPDINHIEQFSIVIRFVNLTDVEINIKEHFLEYIPINDSTGAGLTETILNFLEKYGLDLNDCRGQGYDNGSNMKGKNSGVQKRILDINPLAFFVSCGCHSYNLVLCDAAKSSVSSITLFGVLQRLFTLFSSSVNRWKILTDHLKSYTLKNSVTQDGKLELIV